MAKLAANEKLRAYVQDRLAGKLTRPDETEVPRLKVRWADGTAAARTDVGRSRGAPSRFPGDW